MGVFESAVNDFLTASKRAYGRGIQTGSGGNISARVPGEDKLIVKGSGLSFADLDETNVLVTDLDGHVISGEGKPTREIALHCFLYKNFPHINGVVHTHSPWSLSWTYKNKFLPLITHHAGLKMKYPIPVLNFDSPVVPEEGMGEVLALFQDKPDLCGFLLQKHGLVTVDKSAVNAEHMAELIEETAQISWMVKLEEKLF